MNFGRVVRMAIRYKFTFAASIVSALMVAVLWGANISAVYPVVEVIFKNKSMQQWIDGKIDREPSDDRRRSPPTWNACASSWPPPRKTATQSRQWKIQREIANAEDGCAAAARSPADLQDRQAVYRRTICRDDPFHTLVLITVLLVVGTVLKDVFLVANNVLVARLAQLAVFDLRKLFYRRTLRMDLATFGEDGTADLMSRFTNDMNQVAGGLDSLFGKLIREPLKMFACLALAAMFSWRLLLLTLIVTPVAAFLDPLAGQDAQAGQSPRDGGNGRHLHHPRRDLPQHQDRQGVHQRAAGAQAVPRQQQALLPQGDAHRPLRFAQPSDDRSAGHRHRFAGDDRRRMADLLAGAAAVRDVA